MNHSILVYLFVSVLFSFEICAQTKEQLPNDTRWVRESMEYKSICEQTYKTAWTSLSKQRQKLQDAVIVMDLDETVLDNSLYQVQLHEKAESFNHKSWNEFVKLEISELVPGAKEFILKYKANYKGVIVFISDRDAATMKSTKNNLKRLGILFEEDVFLLKKNKDDTKELRRYEVLEGKGRMKKIGPKSIAAYFGDQIGDFPKEDQRYRFSHNQFIFPNPMYGKW